MTSCIFEPVKMPFSTIFPINDARFSCVNFPDAKASLTYCGIIAALFPYLSIKSLNKPSSGNNSFKILSNFWAISVTAFICTSASDVAEIQSEISTWTPLANSIAWLIVVGVPLISYAAFLASLIASSKWSGSNLIPFLEELIFAVIALIPVSASTYSNWPVWWFNILYL